MKRIFDCLGGRILRNSVRTLLLLLAVSIVAFALVSASPVDPVQQYILCSGPVSPEQQAQMEEYWGGNKPPADRYLHWLGALLHGNLGQSLLYRRPVAEIIDERFLNSLALMICAWLLAGLIGFSCGCLMGMYRDKAPDRGCSVILITHDIDLALDFADRIAVFYAGSILETEPAENFRRGDLRHPYSRDLWEALPQNGFRPIPGTQPYAGQLPEGCLFAPRCPYAGERCRSQVPPAVRTEKGEVRCFRGTEGDQCIVSL